jgi:hypothetical protein
MPPHQPVIAIGAEQPSDFSRSMIVVNRQLPGERSVVLLANSATALLFSEEFFILFFCYPVLSKEMVFTRFRQP